MNKNSESKLIKKPWSPKKWCDSYNQQEGIDYTETFAPIAILKAIRLLLSYAVNHGIILYQMDVKSAFLNDVIEEEVYVKQPPGFEDLKHPNHVYKLNKSHMAWNKLPELGMID